MVVPSFEDTSIATAPLSGKPPGHFRYLKEEATWLPLVRAILGEDCVRINTGVIVSLPGSANQMKHSDGDHLHDEKHLPPHCLNVFLPLVDFTAQNGPTEM
jgi:ectoine hydroxylase-related dioxygenase (phytanoyl-CoA dioxygenase family)